MKPQYNNAMAGRVPSYWLAMLATLISASAGAATPVGPTLADSPLYSTIVVPANVILDISVEFPTATTDPYKSTTTYTPASEFVGYFNPTFCYDYTGNSTYTGGIGTGSTQVRFGALAGYFSPATAALADTAARTGGASDTYNHSCDGTHWSGNFLNWATAQTIDSLRKTMTGGARIVDVANATILQKAYQDSQEGGSNQVVKSITGNASLVHSATPMSTWSSIYVTNYRDGLFIFFSPNSMTLAQQSGSSFVGVTPSSPCPSPNAASGSSSSPSTPASSNFEITANNTLSLSNQGCTGTATVSVKWGSGFSSAVALTVTGLPSGVTAAFSPTSITANNGTSTLTFTAAQGATVGSGTTVTIKGTSGAKTQSVTLSLSVTNAEYYAQAAALVCSSTDASSDLETNGGRCRAYGSNYKPVGLMQKYSAESTTQTDSIRYSIFGYLQDPTGNANNEKLDGGVMRAKMKSVGPYQANPGTVPSANTAAEWDAGTGVFATNPNSADASATGVSNSGVANYLNNFGFENSSITYSSTTASPAYKTYDSVSELYYMATRYYRNLGNLASHTTTAAAITAGEATNDGFPVITTWDDPIAYTCSTNYIVGMGDVHTWNDANLPGSTLNGGYEVADAQVTADTAVNVTTATNWIGNLENLAQYTGAGVVPGSTANNAYDKIQTAALGGTYVNGSTFGDCCTGNTYYMAGLAYDAHVRDQRPDITLKSSPITVSTFWLDVMESEVGPSSATGYYEKNQFWMTAKYGGFNTNDPSFGAGGYPNATQGTPASYPASVQNTPLPVSSWNTAGYVDDHNNYAPDQYYQAGSPAKMASGLNSAFSKIVSSNPAGTSAALGLSSSTFAGSNDLNYVSSFANDWSGSVSAQKLTASLAGGVVSTTATAVWSATSWLPPNTGSGLLTYDTRLIATSTAQGAGHGVKFRIGTGGITTTQQATLGATAAQQAVLNYLRGDNCNESASGSAFPPTIATTCKGIYGSSATSLGFRPRSISVLGDVTNSQPAVYGVPEKPYADAPLNPGYATFKSTYSTRSAVLYVGANDGMLHAFDATTGSNGGKELFAYVPSALFTTNTDASGNPVGLGSLITSPLKHHFMVDAQPLVTDVDFNRVNLATNAATWATAASDWHTIVISGLGKGGGSAGGTAPFKVGGGYVALDVTNPSTITSEGTLAGNVLWETDPSVLTHMGYSYGLPHVVKTKKYGWTLVLTSGYGNDNGQGYFYLVNPKDGSLYETISTGVGSTSSPAGLAQLVAWIPNQADFTADALYAGDLLGNLWRVDLSTTGTLSATKIATLASGDGTKLNGSTAQPVTTAPVVAADPSTGTRYVFVGTGKLLDDSDLVNAQTETFYAFVDGTSTTIDTSSTFPITRANLVSDDPSAGLTLSSSQRGFYIDLAAAATNGAGTQASAERINVQPQASGGTVLFAANLFGQNVCIKGSSHIYALNYDSSVESLGETLLQSSASPSTPVSYLSYPTGIVTNLTLASVSSPLSTSSSGSGLMAMWGLDTTAGGTNQTAKSTVGGDILHHGNTFTTRINWREIPQSQP